MRTVQEILTEDWYNYQTDKHPINRRMKSLEDKGVRGMSTENIRYLFNEIVNNYADQGCYFEVGMYRGCSILSAALYNKKTVCIGVDDFSQFNSSGENLNILKENVNQFPETGRGRIFIHNADFREFIPTSLEKNSIDVYFYDGPHSYQDQLDGLTLILPYLSKRCIILVDDVNWGRVEKANNDFISANPEFKSLAKILSATGNGDSIWHNGIEIISRGFE